MPSPEDLRAYSEGHLGTDRFDVVDRWIAAQDPETQERILGAGDSAGSFSAAAELVPTTGSTPFAPDIGTGGRFTKDAPIGAGGMGIVDLLKDRVLGRDIVVKRCRPRRPDESIAAYSRRQQLFKREAQLTAQLEHPGIVPVHDVGEGPLGEPAFTMKRLDGEPLSAIISRRRAGEAIDVPRLVEVILRVADAVGYAHSRGIVHRDIKPDNIIVGALGAVYVIDWGLAGTVGAVPTIEPGASPSTTLTGSGMGTPAWMAPEQFGQVKADPRMDVFALGGLLMATLTGKGPRDRGVAPGSHQVNLKPLDARLPRGLVAVARRCLEMNAVARYADASAVADDLRQWLAAGLTSAENPSLLMRVYTLARRSRKLSAAVVGTVAAVLILSLGVVWRERAQVARARAELDGILTATAPPADVNRLNAALLRVRDIRASFPSLLMAVAVDNRLVEQIGASERQQRQQQLDQELRGWAKAFTVRGEWVTEIPDITTTLRSCGLKLEPDSLGADRELLAKSPLRDAILPELAHLLRAYVVGDVPTPLTGTIPRLIVAAAPDAAWRGLGELLEAPSVAAHDLNLPAMPGAIAAAAATPATADLMLSLFGPNESLMPVVNLRLRENAGAFWPHVIAARALLAQPELSVEEYHKVEQHAWAALGIEPQSIWPHLLFAYFYLAARDYPNLLTQAVTAWSVNPDDIEIVVLRVVGMSGLDSREDARKLIENAHAGAVLRFHHHYPMGHPIERAIDAMLAEGIEIPAADAELGPLVEPKR